jgi:hypothetical protein
MLMVCPTGEVTSIWYQQEGDTTAIRRGDLEIGFIFRATQEHCQAGDNLEEKNRQVGEKIIASLKVWEND